MTTLRPARREPRAAFTLVELLMVIVIIGILAGVGTAAFIAARGRAINARMSAEIDQLGQGIEKYRQDHGEYFPNPSTADDNNANVDLDEDEAARKQRIMQHIRKAFPRYLGDYNDFAYHVGEATFAGGFSGPSRKKDSQYTYRGLNVDYLDAAEVLVFFLGGLPNQNTETPLTGFAADPQNPFQAEQVVSARTPSLFNFDTGRLKDYDQDGWFEYVPAVDVSSGHTPPYVYFDNRTYKKGSHYPYFAMPAKDRVPPAALSAMPSLIDDWGWAMPYLSKVGNPTDPSTWAYVEPKGFQIIGAGRDGRYSKSGPNTAGAFDRHNDLRFFPDTKGFATEDNDNVSNFTSSTLDSEKP